MGRLSDRERADALRRQYAPDTDSDMYALTVRELEDALRRLHEAYYGDEPRRSRSVPYGGRKCPDCYGTGGLANLRCARCQGKGSVRL